MNPASRFGLVFLVLIGFGIFVLIVLYLLSPYWAMYSLGKALESGNADALERRIDFPSVRRHLKEQMKAEMLKEIQRSSGEQSDLARGLAATLGPKIIDNIVDSYVTPSGIAAMIEAQQNDDTKDKRTDGEKSANNHDGIAWDELEYAFFRTPTQFEFILNDVGFRMELKGRGWKLTRIDLSEPLSPRDTLQDDATEEGQLAISEAIYG